MDRDKLRSKIGEVADSYHATLVLRHDVHDPIPRAEFIEKMGRFIEDLDRIWDDA